MNPSDADAIRAEVFVVLHEAVLRGFFDHCSCRDDQLIPLAADILIRMDSAYHALSE